MSPRMGSRLTGCRLDGAALAGTQTEVQRLYDEDAKLREAIGSQTDHLAKTYAEIERLSGLIKSMEGTRAWKLHRKLSRS